MMYLALTYDHRLLDGREAVIFLVKVRKKKKKSCGFFISHANSIVIAPSQIKEYIEDPRRMLLA